MSNNRVRGNATSGALPTDNVIVTFPQAITKLTLTYRNTTTSSNINQQAIGIPSFGWCGEADVATTLTGPTRAQAGTAVNYTVTTTNNGPDAVTSVTPTLQMPANLTGLGSSNGGTYNSSTGLVTFPTISNLAAGASVTNTLRFTMPATNSVTGTAAYNSSVLDNVSSNNTATLSTTQNQAPTANNVTNSPAMLNTNGTTAIAPLSATDPDGNSTIASYTLVSLPTAAQGILYVNGTAATAGQSLTPAQISQLSFAPNGTFTGNATFTFSATDDLGVVSNTATYTIPVTAGADLATTISGSTTGVEGQSRVYGATTTNLSSGPATNVVATITLSNKPPFSTVTVNNGSYDPATGVVTFNPVTLAGGAQVVNTVSFIAQASPATITATAASTSSTPDPNAANNNGTAANATITTTIAPVGPAATASTPVAPCANPGRDGSVASLTFNPNTYYPADTVNNQTLAANATQVVLGRARGTQTAIAAGDLLLIIQMQGADFDATNTDSYGDGVAGGLASGNLNNANFTAGRYEYVVAANAVSVNGGTLTLTQGTRNAYQNAAATATTGQRRFQVIRIPQYADLGLGANLAAARWNGRTGGILVLDVTGRLTFNGFQLDASGAGFRGGAGRALAGATGLSGTDYRTAATAAANAMKGEGIAGTPRYVNTGTATFDTGIEGYANGSAGRGAPGNAGGGGTDANPSANDQNSGGGGGGNGARGGRGGNSATSNTAVGGELGSTFGPPSTSRLILGGGGGAGVNKQASGTGGAGGYNSSGAAGGGVILIRTGSINGTGRILASGANASSTLVNDGSGGGGAGGSILVTASNGPSLGGLTLTANGGNGGSNSATTPYGPGGGGGGGIILANANVANAYTAGGQNGTTNGGVAYGAAAGVEGLVNTQVSPSIQNSTAGINCSVDVVATITGPSAATAGQTVTLSAVFANNGGVAASNVTRQVVLPPSVTSSSVTASGGTISTDASGNVVVTYPTLGTLAAGASTSFGLSYTAPGVASVTATANVTTTTTPEPVTANNTASTTTPISGAADVVSAILGLNTMNAGRPSGVYSVVFANNGPAAAADVTRTVTLPAGIAAADLTVYDGATYSYDAATGVINFGNVASLNSRAAQVFRFSFTAPTTTTSATIRSLITTTSDQGANVAADAFAVTASVNNVADVYSTVTPGTSTVAAGQQGRFEIGFVNDGPSTSTGVLRRVQLTAGLTNVVATNGGTYDPATGIVTYGSTADLPSKANASSTITFTAPASGVVTATANMNDATIFSGNSDNNQATGSITITPLADIATRISGPATSVAGNLVLLPVTTSNSGPSPASNVVQTVTLPANLAGVFASDGGEYNAATGVVTFPALATLASGQAVTRTINVVAPASNFTARATVTASSAEPAGATGPNTFDASVTTSAATTAQANLYTTVDLSAKNVAPNAPVTFTVVIGNRGPQPAVNAVQRVSLPPGLTNVTVSDNGTYDAITGVVTFPALASLGSSASQTRTISLMAPAAGLLTATSNVNSDTSDPMPADDMSSAIVVVTPVTDVTTTLLGPSTASAGQNMTLTVNTINNGRVPASNVVQTVTIPAGLAPADVTISAPGATYSSLTGLVTFPTIVSQQPGNVVTNTITYKMPAYRSTDNSAPRTFENRASVTTYSTESVLTNNAASVLTEVKWNADVAVSVAGPGVTVLGNPALYTVSTVNNGPGAAASVTTRVRIVTGLTGVVASGGGVYDSQTGIVTFPTLTNQPAGPTGVVTNTISFLVPDRPIIGVAAVADVPTSTNDSNLLNNASTIVSPVQAATATQVDLQTTISADVTQQIAGQPVVLTVNSINNSGVTATGTRQRVSLAAGLTNVVVQRDGVTIDNAYNNTSGIVTLPLVDLAANTSVPYTITVYNTTKDPVRATAYINGTFSDPTPANNIQSVNVTIVPAVDILTRLNGPTSVLPGTFNTYQVVTLNNGPSPANSVAQTVQLPTGLSNVQISGGGTYDAASGLVTFPTLALEAVGLAGEVTNTIIFPAPNATYTLTARVTSATTEVAGATANNTAVLNAAPHDILPVASDRLNRLQTPQGNTSNALLISALTGYTPTGTPTSYQITTLPPASQGTLTLRGAPVTVGQTLPLADISALSFAPNSSFVGNTSFTYTTTDDSGIQSIPARYTITVGRDNPSVYTNAPTKGGANPYQDNDVIANVLDVNGASYDGAAALADNGVRSAVLTASSNPLPGGVGLDPNTGQLYVNDRTLLVEGPYTVTITTTDAYGGITSQPVSFSIGARPLPVELKAFAAKAQGQDALVTWSTASEKNNDHFVVERSVDGRTFTKAGTVRGHGTTLTAHDYSFVDKGAARFGQLLYYRLKQVDGDSTAQYSPVRTVSFPVAKVELTLYPNPAVASTTLDLTTLPVGTYRVSLVDMTGRTTRQYTVQGGLQPTLDLTGIAAGSYVVLLQGQDAKYSLRLVKHD